MRALLLAVLAIAASSASAWEGESRCPSVPTAEYTYCKDAGAKDVIFFSDGSNFDDTIVLHLLMMSKNYNLRAIYTQGNGWANPASTSRNFYNIMYLYGVTDVPIWSNSFFALEDEVTGEQQGRDPSAAVSVYRAPVPLGPGGLLYTESMWGTAPFLPQGPNMYNPLTSLDSDADSLAALVEMVASLERVTFYSSGTLTPIAKSFDVLTEDELQALWGKVEEVVIMGGAVDVPGNLFSLPLNTAAEFNMYNDPHAASLALTGMSSYGVPIILVPLDATNDVLIEQLLFDSLLGAPETPEAQHAGILLQRLKDTWFAPDLFFETAYLWDPSAVIVMMEPSVVTTASVIPLKVVYGQGILAPTHGATRECTDEEAKDLTICAQVNVITGLDGAAVNGFVIDYLQRKENSAVATLNLYDQC